MTDHPENPPAFPRPGFEQCAGMQDGMTLRDYFAASALPALISGRDWTHIDGTPEKIAAWAKAAYLCAEAMLRERCK